MKKIILSSILLSSIFSSFASADLLRIGAGTGIWSQNSSGISSYNKNGASGTDTVIDDKKSQAYFWSYIKHPLPILPNLRLEYSNVEYNGLVSGSFDGFQLPSNKKSHSHLSMTQYDVIPYYNIWDNTFWTTIDIGLDIKVLDSDYTVDKVSVLGVNVFNGYEDKTTTVVPLGYLRTRVEIPSTNIGIEGDVKYISYDGNTISDARAKVDFSIDIPNSPLSAGLEVGYRYQHFYLDDKDGTKINLTFDGLFAGVNINF